MCLLFNKFETITGLLLFAVLFPSCSSKPDRNEIYYQMLDESLTRSDQSVKMENEMILASIKNKLADPLSNIKAQIWYPRVQKIDFLSSGIIKYVDSLKSIITGSKTAQNEEIVQRIFIKEKRGEELSRLLTEYRQQVLLVDPLIYEEFENNLIILPALFDSLNKKGISFTQFFFQQPLSVAVPVLLSQFISNVRITENRLLSFCNDQATHHLIIEDCSTYAAIIGQSSTYVRGGEEIEITAGVGKFNTYGPPHFIIREKDVKPGEDGTAHYKFRTPKLPGLYKLPVVISYTGQDGKKITIRKTIGYTVAE